MKPSSGLALLALLLISCSIPKESAEKEGANLAYQAVVVDSIVVDYRGPLFLVDAADGHYLGVDDFTHSLVVFDENGKICSKFANTNESSTKSNKVISTGFIGDSLIMVTSHTYRAFYTIKGELTKVLPTSSFTIIGNNNLHLDLEDVFISEEPYVLYFHEGNRNLPITQSRYWRETRLLTMMNLATNEISTRLSYEKESIYRRNDKFYYKYKHFLSLNRSKTELYFTYQVDKNIYIYDLTDPLLPMVERIPTTPQHFANEPTSSKFNSGSERDMLIANATDSRYSAVAALGDSLIITQYGTYMPRDKLSGNESVPELLEVWVNDFTSYLEVYDRSTAQKISNDIKLNKCLWNLKLIKQDTLLFEDFNFNDKKEKDYNIFYKVILI